MRLLRRRRGAVALALALRGATRNQSNPLGAASSPTDVAHAPRSGYCMGLDTGLVQPRLGGALVPKREAAVFGFSVTKFLVCNILAREPGNQGTGISKSFLSSPFCCDKTRENKLHKPQFRGFFHHLKKKVPDSPVPWFHGSLVGFFFLLVILHQPTCPRLCSSTRNVDCASSLCAIDTRKVIFFGGPILNSGLKFLSRRKRRAWPLRCDS